MAFRWICDDPKTQMELCLNQAFVKDGVAWYRDFDRALPARDLIREIFRKGISSLAADGWKDDAFNDTMRHLEDDDIFDCAMHDFLYWGTKNICGVCGILYFLLVGAAENHEKLKSLIGPQGGCDDG